MRPPAPASALLSAIAGLLTAAYPLLAYALLQRGTVHLAGLALLALIVARQLFAAQRTLLDWLALAFCALWALALYVLRDELLARLYPVIVNLGLLFVFARTLLVPPTIIARIASATGPALDADGLLYTTRLTRIWCVFFVVNAAVALATALVGTREIWALYNGLIAYGLAGALLFGERLLRPAIMRRMSAARAARTA